MLCAFIFRVDTLMGSQKTNRGVHQRQPSKTSLASAALSTAAASEASSLVARTIVDVRPPFGNILHKPQVWEFTCCFKSTMGTGLSLVLKFPSYSYEIGAMFYLFCYII